MSGCGTRIVLRGQKPLALCDRCPCFGSLFPPLAALTFAASSIICAFGLAAAAPRSPYRLLELCGVALTFIFALKILPRRYPSVAFEEQDERRWRGKTGTFGHIFDQFPLGDQFLRVLQFGLVDLVGKLFAGIDAVKAGQIRRVKAGHAGKGSQGKVIVFHVVLNITVDPLDDGLGAVGFVFLALAVLLRFVPGLRFSALLCLCAAAVLFVLFMLECAARRGSRAAVLGRRVLRALLAAGFVLFAALETMVIRGSLAEKTDEPVSAVIVLGAGVNGETPSLTLRTRIDAAAAYLEEHPDVPVVLSGGQGPGEAITEAECMRRALVRRGVDESRLYPEERSTSTQENLRYSRAILEELGVDPARRHRGGNAAG